MDIRKIGVVGGGAWGTALAQSVSQNGYPVKLWAYEKETVDAINDRNENPVFLPNVALNSTLSATSDFREMSDCDVLLVVSPAQFLGKIAAQLKPHTKPDCPFVICSKGIEIESQLLMSQVLENVIPDAHIAVLSGPSFAIEVAQGLPAALTLACEDEETGLALINALGHTALRLYWSSDVIGAQIGGAIKNVIAIACGICEGKNFGRNAHAALTTRGYSELVTIGKSFGGRAETLTGLSGLGDLILTCSSSKSRNMSLGFALGEGKSLDEILGERKSVTEGGYTSAAIADIAQSRDLELPICTAVDMILKGKCSVDEAIEALLSRPFKAEIII